MKVVVQRVKSASVRVNDTTVGKIGPGLLLLVGVAEDDRDEDVAYSAGKCAQLRIFNDHEGKMNRSVSDAGGAILAVSQFTLLGDIRRGRRPSFIYAAGPEKGERLYEKFIAQLKEFGIHVETGIFGAMMDVELINDGPVTLIVDSREK